MPFTELDALEIAAYSKELEDFRGQHPETIWTMRHLGKKYTEKWRTEHPDIAIASHGKSPPKRLWLVEVEDPGNEKLSLVISPSTKQLVEVQRASVEPLATRLPNWNNDLVGIILDTSHWNRLSNESKTVLPQARLGRKLDLGECLRCQKKSTFFVKGEAGLIFCANCGQKYQVIDSVTEEVLSFP